MPEPPNSQVFGGKRAPDDHFAQFSAFGPEKRRIPARRACHRLSPLVTASSPLSLGPKSADWGLVRAWCGPGAGLVRAWCGPGAGLVRAWCGPGNPVVGTGLLPQSCCGKAPIDQDNTRCNCHRAICNPVSQSCAVPPADCRSRGACDSWNNESDNHSAREADRRLSCMRGLPTLTAET